MKRWIVALLALGAVISISGITLPESLEMAKQNNKTLLMAREEEYKADATYKQVWGMLYPQLSLQGAYTLSSTGIPESSKAPKMDIASMLDETTASDNDNTLADVMSGIVNGMIPSSPIEEGSLAAQLKLDQILFSGGKIFNGISAADRYRTIQKLSYSVSEQDVILQTTNMFYQTLLAAKVVDIQREGLETARRHLARVELFSTEGQVSEFDVLRARLEVAKLEPDLLAAESQYDLALSAFRRQIGSDDPTAIPEGEFIPPAKREISLEDAQTQGLQNREDLELVNLATQMREIQLKAEKGNYLPNVALTASGALYTAADEFMIEADDFGTSLSVGIGFQMPLFTGFQNTAKINYARHDLNKARLQLRDTRELVELQIKQLHQKLQHAWENYEVQRQNIQMAERNLQLAQIRYENNVGIQLEVFDAQIMLSSIKLQYLSSIYEVIAAEREFTKSIGEAL
ncbi:MAG: TolC family protein [Candidatus Cloacimonetes bacterium]|nr:TolC family protein [Candidatus Cloacimonadota bacterium]